MSVPQTIPRRLLAAQFEISENHLRDGQKASHDFHEDESNTTANSASGGHRLRECARDESDIDFPVGAARSLERSRSLSCSSIGSSDSVATISTCSTTRRAHLIGDSLDPQRTFAKEMVEPTQALVEPLVGLEEGSMAMICQRAQDTRTYDHGEKLLTACAALADEVTDCSTLNSSTLHSPAQPETPACDSSCSSQCGVPDSSNASDLGTDETKIADSEVGDSENTGTYVADLDELACPPKYESPGVAMSTCALNFHAEPGHTRMELSYADFEALTDCSKDSKRRARGHTTYFGRSLKFVRFATPFSFTRGLQRK